MIRNVPGLIAAMLMIEPANAASASDPSCLGDWVHGDGTTHIRVEPCGTSVLRRKHLGQAPPGPAGAAGYLQATAV
jgi:hypothetical protein